MTMRPVGSASPGLVLLPVAALDLSFHRFDGIAREQDRERQQDVPVRRHRDFLFDLSGHAYGSHGGESSGE